MAAGTFEEYTKFKETLGDSNTIDLDAATFGIFLVKSTSNFATKTLSTVGSVTNTVATGTNFKKALTSPVWTISGSVVKFDAADLVMTATGGSDFGSVFAAVLFAQTGASLNDGANKLMAFVTLSTVVFDVTNGNTLTITMPSAGLFNL